jgi:hypothetical protein
VIAASSDAGVVEPRESGTFEDLTACRPSEASVAVSIKVAVKERLRQGLTNFPEAHPGLCFELASGDGAAGESNDFLKELDDGSLIECGLGVGHPVSVLEKEIRIQPSDLVELFWNLLESPVEEAFFLPEHVTGSQLESREAGVGSRPENGRSCCGRASKKRFDDEDLRAIFVHAF